MEFIDTRLNTGMVKQVIADAERIVEAMHNHNYNYEALIFLIYQIQDLYVTDDTVLNYESMGA